MSPDSQDDPTKGTVDSTFVARDGEDPPHEDDNSKTGYPVVSRSEDPPHEDDNSKTGYPVVSRGEDPPHEDDNSKTGYPVLSD